MRLTFIEDSTRPRLMTVRFAAALAAGFLACSCAGAGGEQDSDGPGGEGDGGTSSGDGNPNGGGNQNSGGNQNGGGDGSGGGVVDGSGGGDNTGAGGNSVGGAGSGGGSSTVVVPLTDYVSRKWARFPIPNPPSLGLPNPMSYSETSDGILDEVTGLVWQESTNSSTTTWADALSHCESLGDGWTLPTRIELTTIINQAVSGPKVDQGSFSFGAGAGWTWASTPWVVNERKNLMGAAALSWFVNFAVGDSHNSLSQTAASAYSRCVRVPEEMDLPAEHYTLTSDEVIDHYTGLTWQRGHSGDVPALSYEQALGYCESLDLGGYTWRLPSLNEIASIVDDVPSGDVSPATDHEAFPDTAPDAQYWSQSPYGTNSDEHWTLNFEDGFTAHRTHDVLGIARCVR